MLTVEQLRNKLNVGDHIAFTYNYHAPDNIDKHHAIIVAKITMKYEDDVLVHFSYGHHSVGENIKYENIVAIGVTKDDECWNKSEKIHGWGGKYLIINKERIEKVYKAGE